MVIQTSGKLTGGAGMGGTDAVSLQQLLSARVSASAQLHHEVTYFVEWMANENIPWVFIRGFMHKILIALGKFQG